MMILQLIPYFYPAGAIGGPGFQVLQLAKELVRRGNEVLVCTSDALGKGKRIQPPLMRNFDGVQVVYFRSLQVANFYITPGILPFLKKNINNFDIIHMHEFRTFQNAAAYLTNKSLPSVLSCRGSYPVHFQKGWLKRVFDSFIGNRIMRASKTLVASSEIEKNHFPDAIREKVRIIPNSIDLEEFKDLPKRGVFKDRYRLDGKTLILYLGRLHRTKGIDTLIRALGSVDDAVLAVVGSDDGYLGKLKSLVAELGLSEKVTFTGYLGGAEKLSSIVDSDLLVLPSISEHESFGNVVLESVACKRPVVVSDKCGVSGYVKQFNFGEVFAAGDPGALASAINKVISHRRSYSFSRIANFSIKKIASEYIKLYSECIE